MHHAIAYDEGRDVAVLFGGRSCEHEVSVQSASGIMDAMDRDRFTVVPIGVTKAGDLDHGGGRALCTQSRR